MGRRHRREDLVDSRDHLSGRPLLHDVRPGPGPRLAQLRQPLALLLQPDGPRGQRIDPGDQRDPARLPCVDERVERGQSGSRVEGFAGPRRPVVETRADIGQGTIDSDDGPARLEVALECAQVVDDFIRAR
ncbi:MAG: hypothetical protein DMD90_02860 [Candidatus Rokuibacteriota bacterium]|nr:MAG: hypothetical protein DMD90_02860 [Candidatus Rokubacteria bacterium]